MDYGLWNKLYSATLLTPAMLDNDLAYNEDLLANWQAFAPRPAAPFAIGRATTTASMPTAPAAGACHPKVSMTSRAAALIRGSVPGQWPMLQQSANAFTMKSWCTWPA